MTQDASGDGAVPPVGTHDGGNGHDKAGFDDFAEDVQTGRPATTTVQVQTTTTQVKVPDLESITEMERKNRDALNEADQAIEVANGATYGDIKERISEAKGEAENVGLQKGKGVRKLFHNVWMKLRYSSQERETMQAKNASKSVDELEALLGTANANYERLAEQHDQSLLKQTNAKRAKDIATKRAEELNYQFELRKRQYKEISGTSQEDRKQTILSESRKIDTELRKMRDREDRYRADFRNYGTEVARYTGRMRREDLKRNVLKGQIAEMREKLIEQPGIAINYIDDAIAITDVAPRAEDNVRAYNETVVERRGVENKVYGALMKLGNVDKGEQPRNNGEEPTTYEAMGKKVEDFRKRIDADMEQFDKDPFSNSYFAQKLNEPTK